VTQAKAGDAAAREAVCGAFCWAAFAAPGALRPVYDLVASGWLEDAPAAEPSAAHALRTVPEAQPDDAFWTAFEQVLAGPAGGYDAGSVTAAVAALGGSVAPQFQGLAEAACEVHCEGLGLSQAPVPPVLSLQALSEHRPGGLGRTLHSMWVDNGYDPEVLDRDAIGLSALPPTLRYLNTRILQMHDVWHLVAGYETTSLHEIAISGFQLAQFSHNYSAMFLATVAVMSHERSPEGFALLLQTVSEAWRHGRTAPPFMGIAWESCWDRSVTDLRAELGIEPFQGSFPADLFEQLAAAG
jgi:ubiquinone biosynthesis protein Coq4